MIRTAFTIEDGEYLRHGDKPLAVRLFRPEGKGPFPAVVGLHGGAWCHKDLSTCQLLGTTLASAGVLVAMIDFRQGSDGYPTSLADINYAIRWLKVQAERLGTRPDLIGLMGQSSGGHLAMLTAMRPADPRYSAIDLPGASASIDASVRAVAVLWPVINPLSRYRYALRTRNSANPPEWVAEIPEDHERYWKTVENMTEANPMLVLERREKVVLRPAFWLQGRPDPMHDYRDLDSESRLNEPERFIENYRRAGGSIELLDVEQDRRETEPSFEPIAAFFHRHIIP